MRACLPHQLIVFAVALVGAWAARGTSADGPVGGNYSGSVQFDRDRSAELLLESGEADGRRGEPIDAIHKWQRLLDREQDPLVLVDGVYRSGWAEANRRLARLSRDGQDMLELTLGPRAAQAVSEARAAGDLRLLLKRAIQFQHTSAGRDAHRQLAAVAVDRGECALAAQHLGEIVRDERSGASTLSAPAGLRTLLLFVEERLRDVADRAQGDPAEAELTAEDLHWEFSPPLNDELRRLLADMLSELDAQAIVPLLTCRPVGTEDRLFVRTLSGIVALDSHTGGVIWDRTVASDIGELAREVGDSTSPSREESLGRFLTHRVVRDALSEALSLNDERLFALIPQSFRRPDHQRKRRRDRDSPHVTRNTRNTLVALATSTGELQWSVGTGGETPGADADSAAADLQDVSFLGPPLRVDASLLILGERDGAVCLFSLRPANGRLEWSRSLGRVVRPLAQDVARQGRACPLLVADHHVYCSTGAGAIVCVDLLSRRPLWAVRLARDDLPDSTGAIPDETDGSETPMCSAWHRVFLGVDGERLLVATPEADRLLALDRRTGTTQWTRPRGSGLFVVGPWEDRAIVIGTDSMWAVEISTGDVVWRTPVPRPSGEGFLADGVYVLPTDGALVRIRARDGQIIQGADQEDGPRGVRVVRGPLGSFRTVRPHNAVQVGSSFFLQSAHGVETYRAEAGDTPASEPGLPDPTPSDPEDANSDEQRRISELGRLVDHVSRAMSADETPTAPEALPEWPDVTLSGFFVESQRPRRTVRFDRFLKGVVEDLAASPERHRELLTLLRQRLEYTAPPPTDDESDSEEPSVQDMLPPDWPHGLPAISESPSVFDDSYSMIVPVSAPRGSRWDAITVQVDRQGRVVRFDDGRAGGPWGLSLPSDRSNTRLVHQLHRGWGLESLLILRVGMELFAIRPFDDQGLPNASIVWPESGQPLDLRGERPPFVSNLREQELPQTRDVQYLDAFERPVARVGPVRESYLCCRERGHLIVLDPRDGSQVWRRSDLPVGSDVIGDDHCIVLIAADGSSLEQLRPLDGKTLRVTQPERPPGSVVMQHGTRRLYIDAASGGTTLTQFDTVEGRVTWRRTFREGAAVFPIDDVWLGTVEPDGQLHFIEVTTGRSASGHAISVPPAPLDAWCLTDASRLFVFVSGPVDDRRLVRSGQIHGGHRRSLIKGSMLGFDRQTGEALWQQHLDNVAVPLDQPRHVPLLIFNFTRQEQGLNVPMGVIECYDKRTGRRIYDHAQMTHVYHSLQANREEGWVDLQLRDQTIRFQYRPTD